MSAPYCVKKAVGMSQICIMLLVNDTQLCSLHYVKIAGGMSPVHIMLLQSAYPVCHLEYISFCVKKTGEESPS